MKVLWSVRSWVAQEYQGLKLWTVFLTAVCSSVKLYAKEKVFLMRNSKSLSTGALYDQREDLDLSFQEENETAILSVKITPEYSEKCCAHEWRLRRRSYIFLRNRSAAWCHCTHIWRLLREIVTSLKSQVYNTVNSSFSSLWCNEDFDYNHFWHLRPSSGKDPGWNDKLYACSGSCKSGKGDHITDICALNCKK